MDISAVYRELGTFRATAEICGTTAKTVKRVVSAEERLAGGGTVEVTHNYDCVADVVAERVARTGADLGQAVVGGGPGGGL